MIDYLFFIYRAIVCKKNSFAQAGIPLIALRAHIILAPRASRIHFSNGGK